MSFSKQCRKSDIQVTNAIFDRAYNCTVPLIVYNRYYQTPPSLFCLLISLFILHMPTRVLEPEDISLPYYFSDSWLNKLCWAKILSCCFSNEKWKYITKLSLNSIADAAGSWENYTSKTRINSVFEYKQRASEFPEVRRINLYQEN